MEGEGNSGSHSNQSTQGSDPQTWGVAPADPTSEIPVQKRNNKGTVQDRQASVHLVDNPNRGLKIEEDTVGILKNDKIQKIILDF